MSTGNSSNYLNFDTIGLIIAIRRAWPGRLCQTNSRMNGNYLDAVRLYNSDADAGHPDRAVHTLRNYGELREFLADYERGI